MKKTILLSAAAMLFTAGLVSCGGSKNDEEKTEKERAEERTVSIPSANVSLEGMGAQFITLNQDSLKLYGSQDEGAYSPEVFCEIEVVPSSVAPDFYDFDGYGAFKLVIYDEIGKELKDFSPKNDDINKLKEVMKAGATTPVKIRYEGSFYKVDDYNKFFDKAKKATLDKIGYRTNADYEKSSSSSSDTSSVAAIVSSDDDSSSSSSSYSSSSSSDDDDDDDIDLDLDGAKETAKKMVKAGAKAANKVLKGVGVDYEDAAQEVLDELGW